MYAIGKLAPAKNDHLFEVGRVEIIDRKVFGWGLDQLRCRFLIQGDEDKLTPTDFGINVDYNKLQRDDSYRKEIVKYIEDKHHFEPKMKGIGEEIVKRALECSKKIEGCP